MAKEFNNSMEEDLFAGTSPSEALKLLISWAASGDQAKEKKAIMTSDVSWAFFEAPTR